MYDNIGYRSTSDYMALMCLLFSIVFFYFNVGFGIFKEEEMIHQRMMVAKSKVMRDRKISDDKLNIEKLTFIEKEDSSNSS